MRYNELMELAGVKRFNTMTSREIAEYFKGLTGDQPVSFVGSGTSAIALKIGNTIYKFWQLDSAYEAFVKYCQGNTNNPFLPKFLSDIKTMPAVFMRHTQAPDDVHYIKIETLQSNDDIMSTTFETKDGKSLTLHDITSIIINVKSFWTSPEKSLIKYLNSHLGGKYTLDDLTDPLKQLIQTLMDLRTLGFKLDLHDGNFMMRGNQLVIIDPLFDPADVNLNKRFRAFDQAIRFDNTPELAKPAQGSK